MFNVFDIGILLLFICFFIVGIKRGVILEAVNLIAIVLVFVLSFSLKGIVGNILCMLLPFSNFWGSIQGLSSLNILIYQLIAFLLVFVILLFIYEASIRISRFLQKIVNYTIILIIPSKILGGIVSLIKGYIILFAVFLILMIPIGNTKIFQDSKCISYMLYHTPILSSYSKDFVQPIQEGMDLSEKVVLKKISIQEADRELLNVLLKYNVVDKKTVESLVEVGKLSDIQDIEEILNQY